MEYHCPLASDVTRPSLNRFSSLAIASLPCQIAFQIASLQAANLEEEVWAWTSDNQVSASLGPTRKRDFPIRPDVSSNGRCQ